MNFHRPRATVRSAAAVLAFLVAVAAAPADCLAEEDADPPGRSETRRWVVTKDGVREVVVTPAQAAKRAERKQGRAAKRAADRAKDASKGAVDETKQGAGDAADKVNGAAGAP